MKSCFNCGRIYDPTSAIPKLLPCGHTICALCLPSISSDSSLTCPKDNSCFNIAISSLSTNYTLLESTTSGTEQHLVLPKCVNGHDLLPQLNSPTPFKCSSCRQQSTEFFQCVLCLYQLCTGCLDWISNTTVNKFNLRCPKNHLLRDTEEVEKFYQQIRPKKKHMFFLCDGCLERKTGSSLQCRPCKIDYCEECIHRFDKLMAGIEVLMCGKKNYSGIFARISGNGEVCGSRLAWRSDCGEFGCGECGRKFNKSGSFICRQCRANYCINCVYLRELKRN